MTVTQDPCAAAPSGLLGLDEQVCYAIYSAGIAIQRAYKPVLNGLGLTYPQYLVMNVLWRSAEQTVGAIADRLALEPSTITPLLKRLETAGLVQRTRSVADERKVLISLTDAGKALEPQATCLAERLLSTSGSTLDELGDLNRRVAALRDSIYAALESAE
jgi:DNA-binding MarR family transcriptional regulator